MQRATAALTALTVILLSAVAFFLFGTAVTHAQSIQSGDNLTVPSSQTIDGSFIAGGRSIDIGGTVNGDVICGTQSLTISGTVHGDVLCGAQSITLTGHVDGDVRLAGQSITLSGAVGHNASVVGQSLNFGSNGSIGGDLSYAGTTLTSDGKIGRDLLGGMQAATLSGSVGRNVTATVNQLQIASGATINGAVKYTSNTKASVASGAHVGSLQQSYPTAKKHEQPNKKGIALFLLWFVLAALFCSLVLVLIMPLFFWRTSEEALARPGWTILAGFLAGLVLPALTFLSFVTVIGIPLGIFLLFLNIVVALLSFPVAAFYLGRLLFSNWLNRSHNAIVLMLLGAFALCILLIIPIINIIAWLLMIWIGLGSMVRAFRHRLVRPDYRMPEAA